MKKILTLHNDIREIPQLSAFVESMAEEASLDMGVTMSLNLALEEAVTNVMMYAYPEGTVGFVIVEASLEEGCLTFVLRDKGKPFDPTAAPEADITLGVEERPIGGLGIFLVRQIMDTVRYVREGDENVLILTKKTT